MTKQVQRRRGTATQHTSFTGAEGEISVNTTNKSVHVHDGVTAGGVEAARADLSNVSDANLNSALSGNTVASLTITSADINGGTIDGVTIGGASAGAGTFTSVTGTSLDMNGNADFSGNITLSQATSTTIKRTDNTGLFSLQGGTDALSTSLVMYGNAHATLPSWAILEADTMLFRTVDNTDFMRFIDGTGTIFNETGADLDFRIESDTNTHAFLLRGSDGYVGLGTSNPTSNLEVANISGTAGVEVTAYRNDTTYGNTYIKLNGPRSNTGDGNTVDGRGAITLLGNSSGLQGSLWINAASATLLPETADEATMQGYQAGLNLNSDGELAFWDNGTQKFLINSSGDVGIGTSNPSAKLDVNGAAAINDTLLISRAAVAPKITFENSSYAGGNGGIGYFNSGALTFDTNAAERVRIDASGNVGIGTSSPQTNLHVDAGTKNYTGTTPGLGTYAVSIESGSTGTCGIGIGSHNNIPSIQGFGGGTGYNLALCPANGSVAIGHTSPSQALDVVGNIEVSGGIYLGGTAAANLLDDYEEGTWTPAYQPQTGALGSITYLIQAGNYTKVGRQVTIAGRITTTGSVTIGTASSSMRISGLPFTVGNGEAFYSAATLTYIESWTIGDAPNSAYVATNSNLMVLRIRNAGSDGPENNMTPSEFVSGADGGCSLMFSATYFTA
jgi:hypothetical protein